MQKLSDEELLTSFNKPSSGEHVELNDINGITQGHHRIAEIIRRADDPTSSITDATVVRVYRYVRDLSMFWDK